jgi:hypothetical protein
VMVERESRALAPDYLLSAVVPLQRYARRTGARTLMARKPHLAFLSGLEYRAFPQTFAGPVDLLARARAQGADVIAVSDLERLHYPDRPFLEHLDLAPHVHRILDSPRVILFALGREPGTGPPGAAASSPAAGPAAGSVDRLLERARDLLRRGLPLEGVALLENGWPEIAALEDPQRLAHAHALRGWLAHELGRDEEARTQLQAALGLFRELGDERMLRALEHDLAILER